MHLNTLKPAIGAKKTPKRVGRGIGSGLGKTCGRGHKGQRSRSGSHRKAGFEGGQMPLQRRLPKVGFVSPKAKYTAELRLQELEKLGQDVAVVDLRCLKDANLVKRQIKRVKIIATGKITRAITIKGLVVTKGARTAIEAIGGTIEEK